MTDADEIRPAAGPGRAGRIIHITTFAFVQVEAAMTLALGPDARSPLVTGKSEADDGVAITLGLPSVPGSPTERPARTSVPSPPRPLTGSASAHA
jgi:hypothetical protein